jgi:ATP-binding protein involved in chromosome partitioning
MFNIPFLGEVPLELKVREAGDLGVPVVVSAPDSLEAQAFMEVARNIAGRVSTESARSVQLPVMQAR